MQWLASQGILLTNYFASTSFLVSSMAVDSNPGGDGKGADSFP